MKFIGIFLIIIFLLSCKSNIVHSVSTMNNDSKYICYYTDSSDVFFLISDVVFLLNEENKIRSDKNNNEEINKIINEVKEDNIRIKKIPVLFDNSIEKYGSYNSLYFKGRILYELMRIGKLTIFNKKTGKYDRNYWIREVEEGTMILTVLDSKKGNFRYFGFMTGIKN